jgi:hypothetical protein
VFNDRDKRDIRNDLYSLIGEQKRNIILAKDIKSQPWAFGSQMIMKHPEKGSN